MATSLARLGTFAPVGISPFEQLAPRVHPSAFVHRSAELIGDVDVGEEASIWPCAVLRGDHGQIRVGPRTSIQDGSVCHATENQSATWVGAECTVGHRVVLHGCRVGDHCLVGMGSLLLDNAELGEWCFVGAGALLPPGAVFPARSFILGAPARRIREISDQEGEWIRYACEAYRDLTRRYRT
jgi:carbonic anhydrase/acetyltransferase-like protein (isoleucine patch superfamily)